MSHARRSIPGYRRVVTETPFFASTIKHDDSNRIGVWGASYSAGQVFLVAAGDFRFRVVEAQFPVFGAEPL